jgi:catechol 2,3-dioxygenase-like lactoylglutathione lyase family enzyme
MPTTGSLNHIDISVGYPERSIPFYDALLTSLGYTRWALSAAEWSGETPRRATRSIELADGSHFALEVRPARARSRDCTHDRYEPGPHHLAFNAASPEVVRKVHSAMVEAAATVLDPPADYGGEDGYAPGYYAVFFADPDGLKLEVAHVPETNP